MELSYCCMPLYNQKVAPTELSKSRRDGHLVTNESKSESKSRRDVHMVTKHNNIQQKSRRDELMVKRQYKRVALTELGLCCMPSFNHKNAPMELHKSRRDGLIVHCRDKKVASPELSSWCIMPLFNHKDAPMELHKSHRDELMVTKLNTKLHKSCRDGLMVHCRDKKVAPPELSSWCMPLFNHKYAPMELHKSRRDDLLLSLTLQLFRKEKSMKP